jgi:hypothetical protein
VKIAKFALTFLILSLLTITQFAMVSAAPSLDEADSISGTIQDISLITNAYTGTTYVEITLLTDQGEQKIRMDPETASGDPYYLVSFYDDGTPYIVEDAAWPDPLVVPLSDTLPVDEEIKHPVGSALAIFFADSIPDLNYETIMSAHEDGYGFGVIAQALWLAQKLGDEPSASVMVEVIKAKESGDYSFFSSYFGGDESSMPSNWGQFRKLVLDGDKKNNLGTVMSNKDKGNSGNNGNGSDNANAKVKDNNKDKSKTNNGNNGNNGNSGNNANKDNNGKKDKP